MMMTKEIVIMYQYTQHPPGQRQGNAYTYTFVKSTRVFKANSSFQYLLQNTYHAPAICVV